MTIISDPAQRRNLEYEREQLIARLREVERALGRAPTVPTRNERRLMEFERRRGGEGEG